MKVTIECASQEELDYVSGCLANAQDGETGACVDIADGHGAHMTPDEVEVVALP
jgi:hypothetical protein